MRCSACNGNKKIMKLGMTMGECGTCKGTGLEKPLEPLDTKLDKDVNVNVQEESGPEKREPVKASASDCKAAANNTKRKR